MTNIALVPAREGSVRVPNKNLRLIAGRPLISWTIEAALKSKTVDSVFVSTDSTQIASLAKEMGALVPFLRPKALAQNETPMHEVISHFLNFCKAKIDFSADRLILLQPTSPLRGAQDIDGAIALFNSDSNADSLVSASVLPATLDPKKLMYVNSNGYIDHNQTSKWRRLCLEFESRNRKVIRNGAAIYVSRIDTTEMQLMQGNCLLYDMPWERSVDIDTEYEFQMAETLLEKTRNYVK
jgi:CMP-N,N'-diacetyllegionaminic acid synthase